MQVKQKQEFDLDEYLDCTFESYNGTNQEMIKSIKEIQKKPEDELIEIKPIITKEQRLHNLK